MPIPVAVKRSAARSLPITVSKSAHSRVPALGETVFDPEKHGESLAGDLVRVVGRGTIDAVKTAGLLAIFAFWLALIAWLLINSF
jgi:hypothetical protein